MTNKDLARALYAAFARGDTDALPALCAEDMIDHHLPPGLPLGLPGLQQFLAGALTPFSDVKVDVQQMVEEGDLVATHLTLSGTHTGEGLGVPPTGRSFSMPVMCMERLEGGRIVERWEVGDSAAMMQQLGLVPGQ